ncbi:hypothetical protein [Kitasatospora sp. NBC_00315]|uniref:hypothetical protein n=1 Tax=Kitasatospora sp. NBC_00315 TaxID=2975963 RepID=UPI00324A0C60
MSDAVLTPKAPRKRAVQATAVPVRRPRRTGPPAVRALPAGQPRAWYIDHNRRLKAMRLAVVLLDSGIYGPQQANNRRIRSLASRIGIHRPSAATCRMVRSLLHPEN